MTVTVLVRGLFSRGFKIINHVRFKILSATYLQVEFTVCTKLFVSSSNNVLLFPSIGAETSGSYKIWRRGFAGSQGGA